MKKQKRLLVTGCGRSGTKYTAFLLRRLGMDVPHERMGKDGVVSWCMAVNADRIPFGAVYGSYEFKHIFHQIRHPLAVIDSVATFKKESWRFICEHTDIGMHDPLRLRCVKYWYYWNLEAEKIAHWRYRIEDLPFIFTGFCERLQIRADTNAIESLPKEVNTRRRGRSFHLYEEVSERLGLKMNTTIARWLSVSTKTPARETLTWEVLREADPAWSERVMAKANEYGYAL